MGSFIDMLREKLAAPPPQAQPAGGPQNPGGYSPQAATASAPPERGFTESLQHGFPGGGAQDDMVGNTLIGMGPGLAGAAGRGLGSLATRAEQAATQGYFAPDEMAAAWRALGNHTADTGKGYFTGQAHPIVETVKAYEEMARAAEAEGVGSRIARAFESFAKPRQARDALRESPFQDFGPISIDKSQLSSKMTTRPAAWENVPWGSGAQAENPVVSKILEFAEKTKKLK